MKFIVNQFHWSEGLRLLGVLVRWPLGIGRDKGEGMGRGEKKRNRDFFLEYYVFVTHIHGERG